MLRHLFGQKRIGRVGIWLSIILSLIVLNTDVVAQTVSITGTVILEEQRTITDNDIGGYQSIRPTRRTVNTDTASDPILVWLENNDKKTSYVASDKPLQVLDQLNKHFKPRLMAVRIGDFVRIKNSDPVYHNVFSLSKTKRFDVGRRSPRDYKNVHFNKTGTVDVFCDIHSDMHAVIQVLPKYTVTWKKISGSGEFILSNIPKGEYTIHFFAMGNRQATLNVTALENKNVDVGTIRLGAGL